MHKLLEHVIDEINAQQMAGLALAGTLAFGQPSVADASTIHHKHHHELSVGSSLTGEASTYGWGEKLNPTTADGTPFNGKESFVAMRNVPLGTIVTVEDLETGKIQDFQVKDFGPGKRTHRVIDLSQGAWRQFGYDKPGLARVKVTIKQLGKGRHYHGKY